MPLDGNVHAAGLDQLLHSAVFWLALANLFLLLVDRRGWLRWSSLALSGLFTACAGYLAVAQYSVADVSTSTLLLLCAAAGVWLIVLSTRALSRPVSSKLSHPHPLAMFAVVASGAALLLHSRLLEERAELVRFSGLAHQFTTNGLAGVCLFCAMQLTWINSPQTVTADLKERGLKGLEWFAVLCLLIEILVCFAFFFDSLFGDESYQELSATQARLAISSHGFVLTALGVAWMSWMIPHRLRRFCTLADDSPKLIRDWVSLAVAAWILLLVLIVSSSLPATWPWKDL